MWSLGTPASPCCSLCTAGRSSGLPGDIRLSTFKRWGGIQMITRKIAIYFNIFTISCFVSFIIYEMAHNYYLAFDIWRNGPYACNENSDNTASWHYAMLSIFALSIGISSNVLTVCGFLLRGKYGPPFQWMTILAILCYFFPVLCQKGFLIILLHTKLFLN